MENPQKDFIYLIIAFLLLVILPIIAGINNDVEPTYYLLPSIVGAFLIKHLFQAYNKLIESQYE